MDADLSLLDRERRTRHVIAGGAWRVGDQAP